jgi:hypothetical protein
MAETVWIVRRGDLCRVSCYQAREHIKRLPPWTRRWDATARCWLVDQD